jgi:type I restriction enzyme S subunit
MSLKSYVAYKESGVPWLGEVPAHWSIKRAKNVFYCVDVRSETGAEELLTVSSERGILPRRSAIVTMFKAESYVGYKLCWPGDLVINSLWAWARGLGVSRHHGIVSTAYGVYRARSGSAIEPRFVHELVRSVPFQWELRVRSKGIWTSRLQLTDDSFLNAPIPVPPFAEQTAIVRFLDYIDRRIQCYIRAKQKLIKLLEEQKQVIIRRAVTRGLDPNVRLKPSGVEWLGDVPEHWQVSKIRHFASVGNGSTPSRGRIDYWNKGTFPWLNSSVVNQDVVTESDQFVTAVALNECHLPHLKPGYVLIAITGQGKTRGKAALLKIDATINQHIAYIAVRTRIVMPEFLQLVLGGAYSTLRALSDGAGSTKGALTCADLRHFKVPIPPLAEQVDLVNRARWQMASTDTAIDRAVQAIALLREYRTRLIADVVTGKLDVREAAAQLPDEDDHSDSVAASDAFSEADGSMGGDVDAGAETAEA